MRRWDVCGRLAAGAGSLAVLLALAGCGSNATTGSGTSSTATVHGVVKYKGEPVTGGEITFDPTNIKRRDAKAATAPIGKDGTYTVTTLQGDNVIRFSLPPEILQKDAQLAAVNKGYDVPSGDSTFDIDLGTAAP